MIVDEPQIHLGEDIVVPDIAGWRRERMPVPPDVAYVTLAPDWVCEVLSPVDAQVRPGQQERGIRPGRVSEPYGLQTRSPAHWKRVCCAAGSGWRLPRCMTMRQFRCRRMRRSVSVSATCGRRQRFIKRCRGNRQTNLSQRRFQHRGSFRHSILAFDRFKGCSKFGNSGTSENVFIEN